MVKMKCFLFSRTVEEAKDKIHTATLDVVNATAKLAEQRKDRAQLDSKLNETHKKMNEIRKIISNMPFAMRFTEYAVAVYSVAQEMSFDYKALTNEISVKIKINCTEAIILILADETGQVSHKHCQRFLCFHSLGGLDIQNIEQNNNVNPQKY